MQVAVAKHLGLITLRLADSIILSSDTESYAHCALVAHIRRPTACPLCLHVCDPTRDTIVPTIDEQGNTDIHDLGYEGVFLAIGSMLLYLR